MLTNPPPGQLENRPRPLHEAATNYNRWLGSVGALVISLIGYVALTLLQDDPRVGLLGVLPGLAHALATRLTAYGIAATVEPQVTPVVDPRDNDGTRLVRADSTADTTADTAAGTGVGARHGALFGVPDPDGRQPRRRPSDNTAARPCETEPGTEDLTGPALFGAGVADTGPAAGADHTCRPDTSTNTSAGTDSGTVSGSGGYSGGDCGSSGGGE